MAEVILAHDGTIDEFIGDSVLGFFGAPVARADDARRAVACALAMQKGMERVNRRNLDEGLPAVEMGIAVHTGDVVVGNIGSEKRAKYGAVGEPREPDGAHRELHLRRAGPHLRADARGGGRGRRHGRLALREGEGLPRAGPRPRPPRPRGGARASTSSAGPRRSGRSTRRSRPSSPSSRGSASDATRSRPRSSPSRAPGRRSGPRPPIEALSDLKLRIVGDARPPPGRPLREGRPGPRRPRRPDPPPLHLRPRRARDPAPGEAGVRS